MAAPPLVVTRPEPQAGAWVAQLAAHGVDAIALPLIAIAPAPDQAAIQAAWDGLGRYRAALFVSGQAVEHFFGPNRPASRAHSARAAIETRAWAPGPQTADALRKAGMQADRIDAPPPDAVQFDSEHLWPVVAPQIAAGDRVLLVRGGSDGGGGGGGASGSGRDWLAARIAERGGAVDAVAVYVRSRPQWSAAQHAAASAARATGATWLASSSESMAHLAALAPGADWSGCTALCTHPRIAEAARALGFGRIHSTQPGLDAVLASIESAR